MKIKPIIILIPPSVVKCFNLSERLLLWTYSISWQADFRAIPVVMMDLRELFWLCGWIWKTPSQWFLFKGEYGIMWGTAVHYTYPGPTDTVLGWGTCPLGKLSGTSSAGPSEDWEMHCRAATSSVTRTQGDRWPILGSCRTHSGSPFWKLATGCTLLIILTATKHLLCVCWWPLDSLPTL